MSRRADLLFVCLLCLAGCSTEGARAPGAAPSFRVSGATTPGELAIDRVELVFDNGRGDATVDQYDPLSIRANIRFRGAGPFQAQWRVDGSVIHVSSLALSYGSMLELSLPQNTGLPTFQPGLHQVELTVLRPQLTLSLPSVQYFVRERAR